MLMDESKAKKKQKNTSNNPFIDLSEDDSYAHELSEMEDWGQFSTTDINNVNKDSF